MTYSRGSITDPNTGIEWYQDETGRPTVPVYEGLPPGSPEPDEPPKYFETVQDYRYAGSPGNSVITPTLPEGKKYEVTKVNKIKVGVDTDSPEVINYEPAIARLKTGTQEQQQAYRILVSEGVKAYNAHVQREPITQAIINRATGKANEAKMKAFRELNYKTPDGQYISKTDAEALKREAPEVYKILDTQGLKAANEYIQRQNQTLEKVTKPLTKLPTLNNYHQIKQVVAENGGAKPVFRIPSVLLGSVGVAAAAAPIDWPVLLFIGAVVGTAALYQAGVPQKVIGQVQQAISDFRYKAGRDIQASDVIHPAVTGIAVPAPAVGKPSTSLGEVPARKASTKIAEIQAVRGVTIQGVPAQKASFTLPTIATTKASITVPGKVPGMFIAQTGVMERESELLTEIRPKVRIQSLEQLMGKSTPLSGKMQALANLDAAVQEAVQTGQMDSKGAVAYQNARARYLEAIKVQENSIINYLSQTPKLKNYTREQIAAITASMLSGIPLAKPKTRSKFKQMVDARADQLAKSMPLIQTVPEVELTPARTATQPLTRTSTKTIEQTRPSEQTIPAEVPQPVSVPSPSMPLISSPTTTRETTREAERTNENTTTLEREDTIPRTTSIPRPRFDLGGTTDKQKREAILAAGGALAWPQGELNGKKVWHVVLEPYDQPRHLVVVGAAPQGATLQPGAREAYRSLVQLSGKPPQRPQRLEGGAIDPVISTQGGRPVIKFVRDTTPPKKRYAKRFSRRNKPQPTNIAPDVIRTARRQHVELKLKR